MGETPVQKSVPPSSDSLPTPDLGEFAHFHVLEFLAKGGMGAVFRAKDLRTGRIVALKVPSDRKLADPVEMQRFMREARLAERLRHPNICPLLEVGEHKGRPFLALEYIQGLPLLPWVAKNRPTLEGVSRLVAALARAVHYAHQEGVIHRDIKPGNLMVTDGDNKPVLLDFGLARDPDDQTMLTKSGMCVGTPAYMSPEQAFGGEAPTPLADVYGLGAVLFELLCGRPPYLGPPAVVLTQLLEGPPPLPTDLNPEIPEPLERVCLTAMSREPEGRFATAADLAQAIDDILNADASEAAEPDRPDEVGNPARDQIPVILNAAAEPDPPTSPEPEIPAVPAPPPEPARGEVPLWIWIVVALVSAAVTVGIVQLLRG